MLPADFLATAQALLSPHTGSPSQADLRRAVSTAYYAVFYALCRNAADCFIGPSGADWSEWAWQQAFRSLDHGFARHQCRNQQMLASFPPEIQRFASNFLWLQEKRHAADYDPSITLDLEEATECLDRATQAVAALAAAPEKARRDFAIWVTLKHRA